MSADNLLFWMSARVEGSWQQFRAAVEELNVASGTEPEQDGDDGTDPLSLPYYQTLRLNLERLGHAEFTSDASGFRWRINPPSLALSEHQGSVLGILVGARSLGSVQRLMAAFPSATLQPSQLENCPVQYLVKSDNEAELLAYAANAGLTVQKHAPYALLACTPAVDDRQVARSSDLPFGVGWKVEKFVPEELGWRSSTLEDANAASGALFRFSYRHECHVMFCRNRTGMAVPGQAGKYVSLRKARRQVVYYDRDEKCFVVPAVCRPPLLIERALVLCSGNLPAKEIAGKRLLLRYSNVPLGVAKLAAGLLLQELR